MILIVDSFFTGSHKYWGEQLKEQLPFDVELLTLSGKNWKWRMQGGAFELAEKFKRRSKKPDLIIATDMVNLPLFYAYAGITTQEIPCLLYFHENQFAYPKSDLDTDEKVGRENHYAFINLSSALFATEIIFNSKFNQESFLEGSKQLIKALPKNSLDVSDLKSSVIYPGIEKLNNIYSSSENPIILWNHRWEYDKNPELFLEGLRFLKENHINFQLIILGKGTETEETKELLKQEFNSELIHCGFVETREEYLNLLAKANLLPVTSKHDFFGLSVAEAMQMGAYAVLPNHQAYPEHLANNHDAGILYDYPNGFKNTLLKATSNLKFGNTKAEFQFVAVIKKWDQIITKILNN